MKTETYNISAIPFTNGRTITRSQSLTGTTRVKFTLDQLSAYDAHTSDKRINKIIVDFDEDGEELILNRSQTLSGTDNNPGTSIESLSSQTFYHVLQTDFTDKLKRNVYLTIYRDDGQVDVVNVKFTMNKPAIESYENINLLKTDYFDTEEDNEKLLLTFINKNPEVLGLNLIDLDTPVEQEYDPKLQNQNTSNNEFTVGFTNDKPYVQTYAAYGNTDTSIGVSLGNIINRNTGLIKQNGSITLKYRTRAADPNNVGATPLPPNPNLFYISLTANSSFLHLSGFISWNCNDLLRDLDLSTKTITIPLVDIVGTRTNLQDSNYYYFTNVNVGVGTSVTGAISGGYFLVDLYDVSSCDTVTTTTSTITAFVNY